jgi:hypothetical protein
MHESSTHENDSQRCTMGADLYGITGDPRWGMLIRGSQFVFRRQFYSDFGLILLGGEL